MADCFFLHYEMTNYGVRNSTVFHFYADIDNDNIIVFLSEIWTFKLRISRMVWQILVTHISFFSIFKAHWNKSNL